MTIEPMLRTKSSVDQLGVAKLMARVVDRGGATLAPASIRSIQYLLLGVDDRNPMVRRRIAHCAGATLNVQDVVFAKPQLEDGWSVDDIGYNFCHTLELGTFRDSQRLRRNYFELHYTVTLTTGETTHICFRMRMIPS